MINYSCLYNLLNLFIDTSLDDLIMEQTANTTDKYNDQMISHICGCSLHQSPLKKIYIYIYIFENTKIRPYSDCCHLNQTALKLRLFLTETATLPSIFGT